MVSLRTPFFASIGMLFDPLLNYIPTYNKDDDKLNASGKRIKRGLYQTKNSHYINADINGSFNIMRKYLNVASDHILNGRCRGFVVNPYLVTFK